MERRIFPTPLGDVWLWGQAEAFDGDGAYVLAIGGAYSGKADFWPLAEVFPQTRILFGHIPGMNSPLLVGQSVGLYIAAYGAVLAAMGRPVILSGLSLGGTVALGVRGPLVRAVLALEPLMSTGAAWPLRERLEGDSELRREFNWTVFGVSETEHVNRDYFPVLEGLAAPTRVLVSGEPLGAPRPVARMPSLLADEDRNRLAAHPKIRLSVVEGAGHSLVHGASGAIVSALGELIAAYGA